MTLPMWLVLLGGALTLIGGLIATHQANQERIRSANERTSFESEIKRKNEEIARLSVHSLNVLTGGDAIPFTDPAFNPTFRDSMSLWLINGGRFPLYDVTVTITDLIRACPKNMDFQAKPYGVWRLKSL